MSSASLLELRDVRCQFGSITAVDGVSFSVERGEFVTLLGASGCGKTTTLRLIAGFERLSGGTITLNRVRVADANTAIPPQDRRIGMVFQDYALFPHVNVLENVALGIVGNKTEKTARARAMLERVNLAGYEARMPSQLSGGQQQRVALARALAPQPDVLLLDEPFSNLDAALRAHVRADVRAILRDSGTTCIFVTHDQEEALSLSDRVGVMIGGRIAQIAAPHIVYAQPAALDVATFIGEANIIQAEASGDRASCAFGHVPLITPTHGRVKLLVRPEMLFVTSEAQSGVAARVMWREFYGHDQRIGLQTMDGQPLIMRADSAVNIAIGEIVPVCLVGKVNAYPA
jgi:iron(III) transport system ATP-binding protein